MLSAAVSDLAGDNHDLIVSVSLRDLLGRADRYWFHPSSPFYDRLARRSSAMMSLAKVDIGAGGRIDDLGVMRHPQPADWPDIRALINAA